MAAGDEFAQADWLDFLRQTQPDISESAARDAFSIMDSSKNGLISFEEWLAASLLEDEVSVEEYVDAVFAIYDRNDDGSLSLSEVKRAGRAKKGASNGLPLTDRDCSEVDTWAHNVFRACDANADGAITRGELLLALSADPSLRDAL